MTARERRKSSGEGAARRIAGGRPPRVRLAARLVVRHGRHSRRPCRTTSRAASLTRGGLPPAMRRAAPSPELFLLSLAVILLEVSYTRVFSFKLVYYFTYLIIGIALLGLGAAGVLVMLLGRSERA